MSVSKVPAQFQVSLAAWEAAHAALSQVRFTVFVDEQGVPPEVEIDPLDANADAVVHALAVDAHGRPIGAGRLIVNSSKARVGRMAVLKEWRGAGVGAALLETLCHEAKRRNFDLVHLFAQTHATAFYYHHGFLSVGEEFHEVGIPHQEMQRAL